MKCWRGFYKGNEQTWVGVLLWHFLSPETSGETLTSTPYMLLLALSLTYLINWLNVSFCLLLPIWAWMPCCQMSPNSHNHITMSWKDFAHYKVFLKCKGLWWLHTHPTPDLVPHRWDWDHSCYLYPNHLMIHWPHCLSEMLHLTGSNSHWFIKV